MGQNTFNKQQLYISGKEIEVYPSALPNRPVIYLNAFQKGGDQIYQALRDLQIPAFTLVTISGLTWDHDMAPWDIPPISKNDTPCTGGADSYLRLLTNEIMPEVEKVVQGDIPWRGLAGYSLAGLFALYAMYQTELFSRIASMSGSLWFPGFKEYVFSHKLSRSPSQIYFSLGDKESQARNSYLKTVQTNTEEIHSFYSQKGIDTIFQLNPGDHFKNGVQRTASGIAWILSR